MGSALRALCPGLDRYPPGRAAFNSLVLLIGYGAGRHAISLARRVSEFAAVATAALAVVLLGILALRALQVRRGHASENAAGLD